MLERETAAALYEIYERALRTLGEAEPLVQGIGDEATRLAFVGAQMDVVVDIVSRLRAPLVIQYRELDSEVHQGPPDTLPESGGQELVDRLSTARMQRIDDALPSSDAVDEPLAIDAAVLGRLSDFRLRPKLVDLPGVDPTIERECLSGILDELAQALIDGIAANPTRRWVMAQFQRSLVLVEQEDTEGREHFGSELESLLDILGIDSPDGLLDLALGADEPQARGFSPAPPPD